MFLQVLWLKKPLEGNWRCCRGRQAGAVPAWPAACTVQALCAAAAALPVTSIAMLHHVLCSLCLHLLAVGAHTCLAKLHALSKHTMLRLHCLSQASPCCIMPCCIMPSCAFLTVPAPALQLLRCFLTPSLPCRNPHDITHIASLQTPLHLQHSSCTCCISSKVVNPALALLPLPYSDHPILPLN